jgi:hypothetical protein
MKANEYFAALSKEVELCGVWTSDFEEGFWAGVETYRDLILEHKVHDDGKASSSL